MAMRLAFLFALTSLAFSSAGCCFLRRTFGSDRYAVRIRAEPGANLGSDTEVLIVWPSEEKRTDFQNATTLVDAREAMRNLSPGDYEFAYFGTIKPGEEVEFEDEDDVELRARVDDPGVMRWHCDATQGFVFTTMELASGTQSLSLGEGPRPFEGWLEIHLLDTVAELEHFPSREAWVARRVKLKDDD